MQGKPWLGLLNCIKHTCVMSFAQGRQKFFMNFRDGKSLRDSGPQAFGSGQQNLPLEDFEGRILRMAFYKFPSSSLKTFHFVQFLNKIHLSIYFLWLISLLCFYKHWKRPWIRFLIFSQSLLGNLSFIYLQTFYQAYKFPSGSAEMTDKFLIHHFWYQFLPPCNFGYSFYFIYRA